MTFDERLLALIKRLGERVHRSADVVEHNERGVALQMLVTNPREHSVQLTEQERAVCNELLEELGLDSSL